MGGPRWYDVRDPDERARQVARAFEDACGEPPAGVWAAPGRVNLIGEHTDYNGGLCLPIALQHSTFIAASALPGRIVARSVQRPGEPVDVAIEDVGPGRPQGWGGYLAGAVVTVRVEAGTDIAGITALIDSDVPVGAGLSSSAALSCSAALATTELAGLGWADDDAGRQRLVEVSVRGENEIALVPSGGMDQAASLLCREGHALLLDCADGSHRQVHLDLGDLALLVIDTQAEHAHSSGEYAARRASCEQAARLLGVPSLRNVSDEPLGETLGGLPEDVQPLVRHVVTEIGRVREFVDLLEGGRLAEVGPILDASHASLRDDYRVSCRELDLAVETARSAGALGARMTGGGFGGSAIALIPAAALDEVAAAVDDAFMAADLHPPAFAQAFPAGAARRRI